MFPSLAARETYAAEANFAASRKHFCFPYTTFVSATYVSHFSHDECFSNNVS